MASFFERHDVFDHRAGREIAEAHDLRSVLVGDLESWLSSSSRYISSTAASAIA